MTDKPMQIAPEYQNAVGELVANIIKQMVEKLDGELPWRQVVYAAAVAVKGFGTMASGIEGLSGDEARDQILAAITSGLVANVTAVHCNSREEFDELSAAAKAVPASTH
jgi:hypothetical protein